MKERIRNCLRLVLLVIGCFGLVMVLRQVIYSAAGGESYDTATQIAFQGPSVSRTPQETESAVTEETQAQVWVPAPVEEEDPHMEALKDLDLEALRQVNPDVLGWILIPDSKINYPLMQGTDNDYYLNNTWDGEKNIMGSIFLEYQCSADLTDFNTIVYGHNMTTGTMFGGLSRYVSPEYLQKHPYVYIASDQGVFRYEIFACYRAPVDSLTYGLRFQQDKSKRIFLAEALENSQLDPGIRPEITDRILTLSTCSGAGYTNRWVVQARLKMILEDP